MITMMDHRSVCKISFILLLVVNISFGSRDSCGDVAGPEDLIVQFRGASCTANTPKSCVGDWCFEDREALPIGLFKGTQAGTRAPVLAYGEADREAFYTVIMIDPDAPNPSNPTSAPWLHWMMVNIQGQSLRSDDFEGDTKKMYAPPTPPSGIHRYEFHLYRQPGYLKTVQTPTNRARFDDGAFVKYYRLEFEVQTSFKTGKEVTWYREEDA